MTPRHHLHEERSLRMHRMVAERFREDPAGVIECGLNNLKRWQQNGVDCDDFRVWDEILRLAPQRIPEILNSAGEEATRLRQSSPFAGLIPEAARQKILSTTE